MASLHKLLARVEQETGVKLESIGATGTLLVDIGEGYVNELIGPVRDPANRDVRVFLNHRMLDGSETVSLLLQDADDDSFLNGGWGMGGVTHSERSMWDYQAGKALWVKHGS